MAGSGPDRSDTFVAHASGEGPTLCILPYIRTDNSPHLMCTCLENSYALVSATSARLAGWLLLLTFMRRSQAGGRALAQGSQESNHASAALARLPRKLLAIWDPITDAVDSISDVFTGNISTSAGASVEVVACLMRTCPVRGQNRTELAQLREH